MEIVQNNKKSRKPNYMSRHVPSLDLNVWRLKKKSARLGRQRTHMTTACSGLSITKQSICEMEARARKNTQPGDLLFKIVYEI